MTEPNKTWWERMDAMSKDECLPLEDSPRTSIYSAVFQNKKKLKGRRFRTQQDDNTGTWYVCRIK